MTDSLTRRKVTNAMPVEDVEPRDGKWKRVCKDSRPIVACLLSCFGAFSMGVSFGWFVAAREDLDKLNLDRGDLAQIAALNNVGMMVGALIAPIFNRFVSAHRLIPLLAIGSALSWLPISVPQVPLAEALMAGRVLTGFFTICMGSVAPSYIALVAPSNLKTGLLSSFSIAQNLGLILVIVVGPYLSMPLMTYSFGVAPSAIMALSAFVLPRAEETVQSDKMRHKLNRSMSMAIRPGSMSMAIRHGRKTTKISSALASSWENNGKHVEPKTEDNDKHVIPSTEDNDKHVEPNTEDNDKHVVPNTEDNDKHVEPNTGDNGKQVEPNSVDNGKHVEPNTEDNSKDVEPNTVDNSKHVEPDIEGIPQAQLEDTNPSLKKLLSNAFPVLVLGSCLTMSGIQAWTSYPQDLISNTDFITPLYLVCWVVGSILSVFVTKRLGRRFVLIVSPLIMAVCTATLSVYYFLDLCSDNAACYIPYVCVVIFFISVGIGIGTLSYVLMGDHLLESGRWITIPLFLFWQNVNYYILDAVVPEIMAVKPWGIPSLFVFHTLVNIAAALFVKFTSMK